MKSDINFKRLVIKIGTSVLTDKHNRLDRGLIRNIVLDVLNSCEKDDKSVINIIKIWMKNAKINIRSMTVDELINRNNYSFDKFKLDK